MEVMYDSTDVSQIPADATAVGGFLAGALIPATYPEVVRRWPHAHHLSIAVVAGEDGDCLDIEKGDATPADAPPWFHRQVKRGVGQPVLYANLSTMLAVIAALTEAGIQRHEYRLWTAHYTDQPHLCGPSEGLPTLADATQWTDHAHGRNLDQSLCAATFFGYGRPYVPADEASWEREYDQLLHRHTPRATIRRRALQRAMKKRVAQIIGVAEDSGWDTLNRESRLQQLLIRTGGK